MKIVILGLSITSSWGNGHATTYRGLARELAAAGHEVVFLERDVPWYASNRDCRKCKFCKIGLYRNLQQLQSQFAETIRTADLVIVGSYVPDGIWIGEWVHRIANGITAFYDIDTPVTLAKLERNDCDYLSADLIREYQIYLSFTGGPTLKRLETQYRSPMARALYCSVDLNLYSPAPAKQQWVLGYLGTYSPDRQPGLQSLLIEAALASPREQFVVAGPQYPHTIVWPKNVKRIIHLEPSLHRAFYNQQKFTLNITREDMKRAGYSPSVRLFEAAACGTPIISDYWDGIETFFEPDQEILISHSTEDTLRFLEIAPAERARIGARGRQRILAEHTSAHRAAALEKYVLELRPKKRTTASKGNKQNREREIVISKKVFYESV